MRRLLLSTSRCHPIIFSFLTTVILIGLEDPSLAQDGHYWSENYGNKSMLLSGTVNASVEDLGAVFYNPARLGLIENPAFAISAKVYEYRTIKIENNDEGIKLNKSNFGGAPSLAAGTFKLPFLKDHKFAYSFLTRQRNKIDFFTRIEREGDLIEGLPGNYDIFNGKLEIKSDFREEWIGLTWAPPSTKKYNIGLSTFISTLNKSSSLGVDMNAINEFNQGAYYSANRSYGYDSYGILWKLGLAVALNKIQLGLTVTTPRINVLNKGSVLSEGYLVGIDTTGDGINDDGYVFNNQNNLQTLYKSPWAIGVGIGIPLKRGTIHLSSEWFNQIPDYTILEIDPFVGQSSGDTVRFVLAERLESILNFGIGVEWYFSDKLSAYGSFATDFSAVPDDLNSLSEFDKVANNSSFRADYYQFGGGIAINTKAVEITVGATYKGASNNMDTYIDFPEEGDDNDGFSNSKLTFSSWRFILGFSFPFADKLAKNLSED